jgi:hypothetical protein
MNLKVNNHGHTDCVVIHFLALFKKLSGKICIKMAPAVYKGDTIVNYNTV